jgi:hypothetical protein
VKISAEQIKWVNISLKTPTFKDLVDEGVKIPVAEYQYNTLLTQ